ncbi:MAG: hypothetical protein RL095_3167 [Verrucomicrobiota bacterium]|jgi:prepilin-type N-terminal cleavage/methylation domain-containing protein
MKKSFTLIELLVVVAIIGILASMLLPALSQAKGQGQVALCTNNLRQIGFWTNLYNDDNDGFAPPAWVGNVTWDDLLSKYDGRKLDDAAMALNALPVNNMTKSYRCSLDKRGDTYRTYAMNRYFMDSGVSLDNLQNPSGQIVITERYKAWNGTDGVMGARNEAEQFYANNVDCPANTSNAWWYGPRQTSNTANWEASNHPKRQELPWLLADTHVELRHRLYFTNTALGGAYRTQ